MISSHDYANTTMIFNWHNYWWAWTFYIIHPSVHADNIKKRFWLSLKMATNFWIGYHFEEFRSQVAIRKKNWFDALSLYQIDYFFKWIFWLVSSDLLKLGKCDHMLLICRFCTDLFLDKGQPLWDGFPWNQRTRGLWTSCTTANNQ